MGVPKMTRGASKHWEGTSS